MADQVFNMVRVIDVTDVTKQFDIDPLQPQQHWQLYEWECGKCGQKHTATWQPRIFSFGKDGSIKAMECLKNI